MRFSLTLLVNQLETFTQKVGRDLETAPMLGDVGNVGLEHEDFVVRRRRFQHMKELLSRRRPILLEQRRPGGAHAPRYAYEIGVFPTQRRQPPELLGNDEQADIPMSICTEQRVKNGRSPFLELNVRRGQYVVEYQ